MTDRAETTCPECGKSYQPDLTTGLGGGCPHCVARMLAEETVEDVFAGEGPPQLEAGSLLGGVEILEPLARGGMGIVYKARQPKLNRVVAVKVIDAKLAGIPEFTQRFEREARALAVLNHPHVVQVFDYGHEGDLFYLVMEWVDGTSLREILTAGHLSTDDALRYVPQICDALEYAHAQGVVHRDIKPENILIDRQGQLKIADFGIARLRGEDGTTPDFVTRTGQMMGTPHYMAPEQQKHTDRVDHRADLYSLGVVFYEMLTGELPLGRFPTPSQRVKVDVTLDEVVLKTLEHDPNRRYQRASEIKQALTASAAPTAAAPASPQAAPAVAAPAEAGPRMTGFAWWSLAFAILSLVVLWEMTRAWILHPEHLDRKFFSGDVFTVVLRPLSIAGAVLAWVFGWLALWRVRREQGRLKGRALAFVSMLAPVMLLAMLVFGQVTPWTLRAFVNHDLIAIAGTVAIAALPLLGLWAAFRKLRRYATDPSTATPVKSMVATPVLMLLIGAAAWGFSTEWKKARQYRHQLYYSMLHYDHRPAHAEALDIPDLGDADLWLDTYIIGCTQLSHNLYADHFLQSLTHLKRFDYEPLNGEPETAWMPPSRHYISFEHSGKFRDRHRYLWIHDFEVDQGILTVEYEFPVRNYPDHLRRAQPDVEMLAKKEERIRTNYGVEPDTVYRAEMPLQDLGRYAKWGMDKEFWQSTTQVKER